MVFLKQIYLKYLALKKKLYAKANVCFIVSLNPILRPCHMFQSLETTESIQFFIFNKLGLADTRVDGWWPILGHKIVSLISSLKYIIPYFLEIKLMGHFTSSFYDSIKLN
jgi:hypothetical protein